MNTTSGEMKNYLTTGYRPMITTVTRVLLVCLACLARGVLAEPPTGVAVAEPIKLHPDNRHYFLFRQRPTVLITSGEHYGAVLNQDFDYVRYLDTLRAHGFNLTRTFSGVYREVPGAFGIVGNTLAPAPGRYLSPWARSNTPGAADGGNRFKLTKWDPAYFERLSDFVAEAGQRGIVVELVLFCTMYDEKLWQASPMNARNNTAGIGDSGRYEVHSGKDERLLAAQLAVTRKIVRELNRFDNVYFEICNEPYERGGFTRQWNDAIVGAIINEESNLPHKHLIAENVGQQTSKPGQFNEHVSVLNFHGAPEGAVSRTYQFNRAIILDETGGADRSDRRYRTLGWQFILSGGGVYSHLDFSLTTDRPDGTAVPLPPGTPGGGGPRLRGQLAILKKFIEGVDFLRMKPADSIVKTSAGTSGVEQRPQVCVLAEIGEAYALHINGGEAPVELTLELPANEYLAEWVDTKTGKTDARERFKHAGGDKTLVSPRYFEDVALSVKSAKSH
jgi:hypothetical protein